MQHIRPLQLGFSLVAAIALGTLPLANVRAEVSSLRMTPIVQAVRNCSEAVVNIQGQKTISTMDAPGHSEMSRQVNGMGTGVVIDPRGYILTNHHVVDGVRQINVTLSDRRIYIGKLIARDPNTDLAVIKIHAKEPLTVIPIGTSSDLMAGEPVLAIGNAFGYEHTVTRGIISQLHRDVRVNETQSYDDLIQTDASINPGNSGGPLLGIEGKMIGVNVAVRAGAQGIGFAIPVDKAMDVAARIMSIERLESHWHGMETVTSHDGAGGLVVERVIARGPADRSGLKQGDVVTRLGDVEIERPLDIELALLGKRAGTQVPVEVVRDGASVQLKLAVVRRHPTNSTPSHEKPRDPRVWQTLGLALETEPSTTFGKRQSRYRGGLRVVGVRTKGPAAKQGIRTGDILVGMHKWETASMQDIRYIITQSESKKRGPLKFYVLRGDETLYGHVTLSHGKGQSGRRL